MLNFCIFASGSSGNCSLIRTAEAVVLIDCGVSSKYITENLSLMGLNPQDITAALITHAHGDHLSASGLNFLLKHNIKTYSHDCVFDDAFRKYGEKMNACRCVCVNASFKIKDIEISSFDVYHRDARVSKTLGFTLSSNVCARKYKIGYVTDTGKVCADMASHLKDSNILAIESNYDREMLEKSSRPYENKQWVLSEFGHLSNEDAAAAIVKIKSISKAKDSLKYVFLSHLSRHHNFAELALKTSKSVLKQCAISDINLFAADRFTRTKAVKIL